MAPSCFVCFWKPIINIFSKLNVKRIQFLYLAGLFLPVSEYPNGAKCELWRLERLACTVSVTGNAAHLTPIHSIHPLQLSAKWTKVTSRPVCFGARDDEYGVITVPSEGFAAAMKLQHTSGYLTCNNSSKAYNSRWGCGTSGMSTNHLHSINTYITTAIDRVLFPQQDIIKVGKVTTTLYMHRCVCITVMSVVWVLVWVCVWVCICWWLCVYEWLWLWL